MSNNDMEDLFNTLFRNALKDNEERITNDYINGYIDKDEFLRRLDVYRKNKS